MWELQGRGQLEVKNTNFAMSPGGQNH